MSRNQGTCHFCLLMEGTGSRSVQNNDGSRSGRSKNTRIHICNTELKFVKYLYGEDEGNDPLGDASLGQQGVRSGRATAQRQHPLQHIQRCAAQVTLHTVQNGWGSQIIGPDWQKNRVIFVNLWFKVFDYLLYIFITKIFFQCLKSLAQLIFFVLKIKILQLLSWNYCNWNQCCGSGYGAVGDPYVFGPPVSGSVIICLDPDPDSFIIKQKKK